MNDLVWVWQRPMIEGLWAFSGDNEAPLKCFSVEIIRPCANYGFKHFTEGWRCYLGPIPEIKMIPPRIERQFLIQINGNSMFFEYWAEHNIELHDYLADASQYFETGKTRERFSPCSR